MSLHDINKGIQKNKRRQRVGRGTGSGWGKTSQRGHKGARSRAGWSNKPVFQGGQTPIVRHVPKRGFNNKFAVTVSCINLKDLEALFNDGETVNVETLRERGLCKRRFDEVKLLGDGQLTKKLTVEVHRFSASAKEKVEQAGGTCNVVTAKITVAEKQGKTDDSVKSEDS